MKDQSFLKGGLMEMSTTVVRSPVPFVEEDALRFTVTADELFFGWEVPSWVCLYIDQLLEYGPLGQAAALGMVAILWDGPLEPITGRPRRLVDERLDTPVTRAARVLAAAGPAWAADLYREFTTEVGTLVEALETLDQDAPPDLTLAFALRRGEMFAASWAASALRTTGLSQLMDHQLEAVDHLAATKSWILDEEVRTNPILLEMHEVDETAWWAQLVLY